MRIAAVVFAAALGASIGPAVAYENFIPLGQNYATGENELPPLNSPEARFNSQVDIYESDIYNRARAARSFSTQMELYSNSQELDHKSGFIDY